MKKFICVFPLRPNDTSKFNRELRLLDFINDNSNMRRLFDSTLLQIVKNEFEAMEMSEIKVQIMDNPLPEVELEMIFDFNGVIETSYIGLCFNIENNDNLNSNSDSKVAESIMLFNFCDGLLVFDKDCVRNEMTVYAPQKFKKFSVRFDIFNRLFSIYIKE